MARIPDDLIERLKREVDLEGVVRRSGVELRRVGDGLVGRCPWHEDRGPSLAVTPTKGLWHCLGACQAGGTVIDWVMREKGLDFRQAALCLLEDFFPEEARRFAEASGAGATSSSPSSPARPRQRPLSCPLDEDATDEELSRQVVGYYHACLKESPEAKEYLERRGLLDEELVERFRLGFANRSLGMRLTDGLRMRLNRLGYFRESGHEHFNGSLVIPILSEEGEVLGCYGRKLLANLRVGTPKHLYLPGPRHGVFNPEAFAASTELVLCEALIDALTFWRHGFRNVTTSWGVDGFTADHLSAMKEHGTRKVLIAYDRDEAGEAGALKLCEKLVAEGIDCYRVLFPKGMDANEYARKVKPADKALGVLLRSAEWMGNGKRRNGTHHPAAPAVVATTLVRDAARRSVSATIPAPPPAPVATLPPPASLVVPEPAAERSSSLSAAETGAPAALLSGLAAAPRATVEPPAPAPRDVRDAREVGEIREVREASTLPEPPRPAAEKGSSSSTAPTPSAPDPLDEFRLVRGDRAWRVRGLRKNLSYGVLKLNVLVRREGEEAERLFAPPSPLSGFFVDTLDLYSARQRAAFEKQASVELGVEETVLRHDLGALLRRAEELQQEAVEAALAPKASHPEMTAEEREEALSLLRDPRLLARVVEDLTLSGLVGEETNKLVAYLAATSRKLDRPLAVVVQSTSAAGKSSLMEAVLAFVPEEEREKYSALTANSLFYFGQDKSLSHKVLAIAEEQGAERAAYALKLLQSEGELTVASTGKDPQTGRLVTQEYRVEGPVAIFLTTTAVEVDEELLSRCLVLAVDEEREQTRRIHERQRQAETLEGLLMSRERERLSRLHRNAQRLLRPLPVVNPFAHALTFVDERTRTRRDHVKYLTLIRAVALLFQHQRPVKVLRSADGTEVEYLEVEPRDVALANRLAGEVLGRSLDELPPQTRRLLVRLHAWVSEACDRQGVARCDFLFSARDVRERTGFSHDQVRVHLGRLAALEYVLVHRGGRGQSFVYELLYDGRGADGRPFLVGLLDVEANVLTGTTETTGTAETTEAAGTTQGAGGEEAGCGGSMGWGGGVDGAGWGTAPTAPGAARGAARSLPRLSGAGKGLLGGEKNGSSYPEVPPGFAA